MKELDNLIKYAPIDKDYHNKIFDNMIFENLYTKVNLDKYASLKKQDLLDNFFDIWDIYGKLSKIN